MATFTEKCVCSSRQLLVLFLVFCGILFLWYDETTAATLASKMRVSVNYFADNNNNNTINITQILAKNDEMEQELLSKSEKLKTSMDALNNYKKIEEKLNNELKDHKKIEQELNNKLRDYKKIGKELNNKLSDNKHIEQELANKSLELTLLKAKYSKLYSQGINHQKHSIISTPSTTINSNNDKLSLRQFLKQYTLSTIIQYIREIEASIYFDKMSNDDDDINKLYFTGPSPHFYEGPFDLSPGKTCKVLRWYFHCTPHSIIDKAQFNEWSLRIHENRLSKQAKHFLYILQTKYNFYTNLYEKFIENLKKYNSPYMEPMNVYFFGNSYLQQVYQGMFCLMDDIEINKFNHSYNRAVYSYHPNIKRINNREPDLYNYNDTLCGELPLNGWEYHRTVENNGLGPSFANESLFKQQRNDKNVRDCNSKRAYSKFMDGSTYYMRFNHNNNPKRMENFVADDTKFITYNVPENEMNGDGKNRSDIIRKYFSNQDIIIFNIGNQPAYKYKEDLEDDLKYINHTNKPVLFLSEWWIRLKQERYLQNNVEKIIDEMYTKYPNLIWLNVHKRGAEKLFIWNRTMTPFHYGKYRWLIESEPTGHLCQPGVPEHHILAITELTNLLLHVYK